MGLKASILWLSGPLGSSLPPFQSLKMTSRLTGLLESGGLGGDRPRQGGQCEAMVGPWPAVPVLHLLEAPRGNSSDLFSSVPSNASLPTSARSSRPTHLCCSGRGELL